MIGSFRDREAERLLAGGRARSLPTDIQRRALRRLLAIEAATTLADLQNPPGNRLESLAGDRAGQYSIRVSGQWRVCFRWEAGYAYDIEIVDYH